MLRAVAHLDPLAGRMARDVRESLLAERPALCPGI
jgi:hypothetical protein